jgi:hypothetical protein
MKSFKFSRPMPCLSLGLLWLAFAVLGWYLSANHVLWFVGAFLVVTILTIVRKSSPLFALSIWSSVEDQVVVIMFTIFAILPLVLAIVWSTASELLLLSLLATFAADMDLRLQGLGSENRRMALTLTSGLGLGIGEIIDLIVLPSARY